MKILRQTTSPDYKDSWALVGGTAVRLAAVTLVDGLDCWDERDYRFWIVVDGITYKIDLGTEKAKSEQEHAEFLRAVLEAQGVETE